MRRCVSLVILAFMAAGCAPASAATSAALAEERARVQSALFSDPALCSAECWWESPGRCADPCFWSLPVGEMTYGEWRQFLIEVFPGTNDFSREDESLPLAGLFTSGLFIQESNFSAQEPALVDQIALTVYPQEAQYGIAGYDLTAIAPARIIRHFGTPGAAILLLRDDQTHFRISFWYEQAAFIYEMGGVPHSRRLCLGLDDLDRIHVERFASGQAAMADLELRTARNPLPRLEDYVVESLDDLPRLAAESDAPCLTLRGP